MAKQTINLGTAPTGVGGDTPRSAFTKAQSNFDELYAADAVNYKRANILGPVSQVSGVPTGAIIERGSNAGGDYTKYACGTLICRKRMNTGAVSSANGGVFNSAAIYPGSYPSAFSSMPTVAASATANGFNGFVWPGNYNEPSQSAWGGWLALSPIATGGFASINLIAIGKWFE